MHLSFIEKKNPGFRTHQLINSTLRKQTCCQNHDPYHHHVFLRKAGIIYHFVIYVSVLNFVIHKIRLILKNAHF